MSPPLDPASTGADARTDAEPDLMTRQDGSRVDHAAAWPARAAEWRSTIVGALYGGLPEDPATSTCTLRSSSRVTRLAGAPTLEVFRIVCEGGEVAVPLALHVLRPAVAHPVPVVLHGDACWWPASEATVRTLLAAGVALARFDRTEVADDPAATSTSVADRRSGPLYDAYPGARFGAIAAWAWAYHRCVDLVERHAGLDATRIAVTGFSRGAKAALLAGATDERIALVHDHASGAGGAALARVVGPGGETLERVVARFPGWFGPDAPALARDPNGLPFDQHVVLALIAPRRLLLTYADGDPWSNPVGARRALDAARAVYRLLGEERALEFRLRAGGHEHTDEDWASLLEVLSSL
jgi:hypothetical protein